MVKLLKGLIKFLKTLLSLFGSDKPDVVEQPEQKDDPVVEQPEAEKPEDHEEKLEGPEESDFQHAHISSILWKPVSEGDGNPVILISCDNMRLEDVKLRILNKKGNRVKVGIRNSGHRANGESGKMFGRIHYRLDRSAKSLKRPAPLTLEFYHTGKNGKKAVVIKKWKIKNPSERKYTN